MPNYTLSERLAVAIDIAHEAGRMISRAREQQGFDHRYKDGHELVTDIDVEVDTFITQRLNSLFPGDGILSEELAPERDNIAQAKALWVIDPIDGTVNFAHGLRHVAVSIAWVEEGKARLGVVHAPFLQETFSAVEGGGAHCNSQPIRVSTEDQLARSLIGTGFPYRRESRQALLKRFTQVINECQDIRRNGSAALDLCDVACGRLDGYYESVSPWDFAAGWVIAQEAGASVSHLYPVPSGIPADLHGENLVVATPAIHSALEKLLRESDGE
ncbi:inositol monophosphatase family protein [Halomonas sp. Bachu 37]|uniref:inositol monophosphatase family protein n=1 Tax=Halomonas kashgarensis TaxID=3084920 RepID=UPI00321734A2